MSYIVLRDKPNKCTNCIYMDRITYDCKLMYGDDYPDFETQYNNCPLIEIPTPHGRLIDAELVYEICGEKQGRASSIGEMQGISKVWKAVKRLPTVIEAEGSEE